MLSLRLKTPKPSLDLEAFDGIPCPREALHSMRMSGADWSCAELKGVKIDGCSLSKIQAAGSDWREADIWQSVFEKCDFSGSRWRGSQIQISKMVGCRWSGTDASSCHWSDIAFEDCLMNDISFADGTIKSILFKGCCLSGADLSGASLESVVFEDCCLKGIRVHACRMSNVDFTGSELSDIQGATGLRGATLSASQILENSMGLAASLGIKLATNEIVTDPE
jgi:uncharacterized protein YjbI with pentapeptide repeats